MVMRDLALSRLTGAPIHFLHLSTAASLDLVRQAKRAGARVTCEVAPHHFTLTDAAVASYDPVFKVNPPLRPDCRRGRGQGRLWPTARSTPSPPTTPPMPRRTRRRPSTRPPRGCSAWRRRWPWPSPSSTCPSSGCWPCFRGNPPPSPGSRLATAGPSLPAVRPTCASSIPMPVGGRRLPPGQPQPQLPLCRADPDRAGAPHRPAGRGRGHRRRGPAVTTRRRHRARAARRRAPALLVLADGTTFEGEAVGWAPPHGLATGEVVFNTVLSGYQEVITDPVLRRPDHHLHLPPHRQLRRHPRRRREPPAPLPGHHRARPGPPAEQLALRLGPGDVPRPPPVSRP